MSTDRLNKAQKRAEEARKELAAAEEEAAAAKLERGGTVEYLMRQAFGKYGPPYRIDFFGTSWRVWWTNHHVHSGACTSGLSYYGDTLLEALEKVFAEKGKIMEGQCSRGTCPKYVDD